MNSWSHLSWAHQGAPRIALSFTMSNLHHFSHYYIALDLIFTSHTLSSQFPNILSSLQQMEPTPSQFRNHHSQNNQEPCLERALAFKKAANLHCPSKVCIPIICLHASYCGWQMSPISWQKQDDDTDQKIFDYESKDNPKWTISADIKEDNLDHPQEVLLLCQACWDQSLRTTMVPLPKIQSCANTVIACPPLPNSWNPPGAMAPPLLKYQKSSVLNILSEADRVSSTQALLLLKASGNQNLLQHQMATFEVGKRFMEVIVFTWTRWPQLSDYKYSIVDGA